MKVGIVGMGYVGRAIFEALQDHYTPAQIKRYDLEDTRGGYTMISKAMGTEASRATNQDDVNACDIAFVCVPTPSSEDGRLDTSAVHEVLEWIDVPIIVIRSTMPVFPQDWELGRLHKLKDRLVYQPEFIGESPFAPWREETDVSLVVAGGEKAQEVLDFWKPILGPRVAYIATDWRTAAEIKYAVNCHGAVKAAWWREFLSGCGNADAVRNAVLSIPWIEPYHTLPIGESVGGKCFPKDLRAWAAAHPGPIAKGALGYMGDNEGRVPLDN